MQCKPKPKQTVLTGRWERKNDGHQGLEFIMDNLQDKKDDLDKDEFRKEVGARIRLFRKKLGLKQGQLAAYLNFGRSNLARIEKGAVYPNIFTMNVFKQQFNLSLDWLLYETGEMFLTSKKKEFRPASDCQEELNDLWYHMNRVPMLKHAVLGFFLKYKADHREAIRLLLEEAEKKEEEEKKEKQPLTETNKNPFA